MVPWSGNCDYARSGRRWPAFPSRSPSICWPTAGGRRVSTAWNIWRSSPSRAAARRSACRRSVLPRRPRPARCRRHGDDRFARRLRRPSRARTAAGRDRRRASGSRLAEDRRRDPRGRPGDSVPGVGRIGAIVARDGGWVLLDDKGATLCLPSPKGANGGRRSSPAIGSSNDPAASSSLGEFAAALDRRACWRSRPGRWRARARERAAGRDDCARRNCASAPRADPGVSGPARPSSAAISAGVSARTGRRLAGRSGRLADPPARPSTPAPGRNAPLRRSRRRAKIEPRADARSAAGPLTVVIRRPGLPPRFVKGALKLIVSAVGHRRAIPTSGSARRGPPVVGRPHRRGRAIVFAIGDDAISSLNLRLIKELVDPAQEISGDSSPSASRRRTTPSPCPLVRRSARPSTAWLRESRIRSTALTASTRRAPGNMSANSSPPNRATLSCPRTFCTRMLANRRSRRSPTRWPNRSLTCLKRSMSARARQKPSPDRRAFSTSSAKQASKKRRLPIAVTTSRSPASSARSRFVCSCTTWRRDSSSWS